MRSPSDSQLHIRVIEDYVRTLTPKLQRHVLQVTLRRAFHDSSSYFRRARERNLLDAHVRRYGFSDDWACTGDDVQDARRESRGLGEGCEIESRERSKFGRLEDDGVATCEGGGDLPAHEEN